MSGPSVAFRIRKRKSKHKSVRRTVDFQRIEAIPRRTSYVDLAVALTEALRTPNGTMSLWREQAWALMEMVSRRGCAVNVNVGGGKSLVSYLAPVVLRAQRPLLIVPASLREKTLRTSIPFWAKHFHLHPGMRVISYEQLSQVNQAEYLTALMPDLVIADECHKIRNPQSGVSRRVFRYFDEFPSTMFVGLSGTMTRRSLRDYAHLLKLALGDHSPLPHRYTDLEEWADALDEGVEDACRPDPGALMSFCLPGETPREGFCRRLIETEGYVFTTDPDLPSALRVLERQVDVPAEVSKAFWKLRHRWETPGGETIMTALEFNRHARELAAGFYYRWKWVGDVVDYEWLAARKAWRQFVRHIISDSGRGGVYYDTEFQVARACAAGRLSCPQDEYAAWRAIRKRADPQTEAVWISDFLLKDIQAWAQAHIGIIWVDAGAIQERLRAMGLPVFGAGEDEIDREDGKRTVVASIASHGTGKDLQMFSRNLFLATPGEQSIGRTHRSGQLADEVICDVYLHTYELWGAFEQARKDAAYVETTTRRKQRLRIADVVVSEAPAVVARASRRPLDPLWCKEWPDNPGMEPGTRAA